MKAEAKKYAAQLCEKHLEQTLTRDDARDGARLTVKQIQGEIRRLCKTPSISDEVKTYCAERKKFFLQVSVDISVWDPYKD